MAVKSNTPEDTLSARGEDVEPDIPQDPRLVQDKDIEAALQRAVNRALLTHKRAGNSIAVWRDGKAVLVPAKEISVEPKTLVDVLEHAVLLHKQPAALNHKRAGVWHSISAEKMLTRARSIALGLYSLGVRRGNHIALLSANCPEWTLTDAGCHFAGAVDIPIHPMEKPARVRDILNNSGAHVLFIQHRAAFERITEAIKDCAALKHVVFFEEYGAGEVDSEANTLTFTELEERGRSLVVQRPRLAESLARAVQPEDLATIIYTSGTTGEPKGVMLTHSNLVSNLIGCSDRLAPFLAPFKENRVLSILPLSHALERLAMYGYIYLGMSVYYAESVDIDDPFASERICDYLREVQPTLMVGVPRIFEEIHARIKDKAFEEWRAEMGGRIRLLISGEGALPKNIEGDFFKFAKIPIVQGYGLTETSPVIAIRMPEDKEEHLIGTVGRPLRNVEVRLAVSGEIEVRGPNVMLGYYNDREESNKAFTQDGWLKTRDIGTLDNEGYLSIEGRIIDIIVTTDGTLINLHHIEQIIKQSPYINHVVVVGNGRPFLSALIVPDFKKVQDFAKLKGIKESTPRELYNHPRIRDLFQSQVDRLTGPLPQRARVEDFVLLKSEFTIEGGELTPTLKVKRRVVEEKHSDVIESIYKKAA